MPVMSVMMEVVEVAVMEVVEVAVMVVEAGVTVVEAETTTRWTGSGYTTGVWAS